MSNHYEDIYAKFISEQVHKENVAGFRTKPVVTESEEITELSTKTLNAYGEKADRTYYGRHRDQAGAVDKNIQNMKLAKDKMSGTTLAGGAKVKAGDYNEKTASKERARLDKIKNKQGYVQHSQYWKSPKADGEKKALAAKGIRVNDGGMHTTTLHKSGNDKLHMTWHPEESVPHFHGSMHGHKINFTSEGEHGEPPEPKHITKDLKTAHPNLPSATHRAVNSLARAGANKFGVTAYERD